MATWFDIYHENRYVVTIWADSVAHISDTHYELMLNGAHCAFFHHYPGFDLRVGKTGESILVSADATGDAASSSASTDEPAQLSSEAAPVTVEVSTPEHLEEECKHSDIDRQNHCCRDCDAYVCDNCGEVGGDPVERESREWQGCAEHGGMVTWTDRGCSKCDKTAWVDEDAAYDC